jgi:hypothetical protein
MNNPWNPRIVSLTVLMISAVSLSHALAQGWPGAPPPPPDPRSLEGRLPPPPGVPFSQTMPSTPGGPFSQTMPTSPRVPFSQTMPGTPGIPSSQNMPPAWSGPGPVYPGGFSSPLAPVYPPLAPSAGEWPGRFPTAPAPYLESFGAGMPSPQAPSPPMGVAEERWGTASADTTQRLLLRMQEMEQRIEQLERRLGESSRGPAPEFPPLEYFPIR